MFPSSSSSSPSQIVLHDLWKALQDEEIRGDLQLVGRDGVRVSANRFVLGARSEIFKRMLYGDFREALQTEIHLEQYEGLILQAVVDFCHSNEISQFTVLYLSQQTELAGRRLVQLYKAADYLQIGGLAELVEGLVHNRTTRFPPLACAIYDEADLDTPLSKDALLMIQCRPYVTLPPGSSSFGGISCLEGMKLRTLFVDQNVKAGELFLFEMLQKWSIIKKEQRRQQREHDDEGKKDNTNNNNQEEEDDDEIGAIVKECASHLHLEDIEPQDLLSIVQPSGFCSTKAITKAITCQALRASTNHIWSLSSRGRPNNIERILVEGAGSQDANGIYYYIDGLANGDLYSKREIVCGQQYVYTLSISAAGKSQQKEDNDTTTECRIFCSKLLTHDGCQIIATNKYHRRHNNNNGLFQPLLQIIDIKTDDDSDYALLQLSDGDHYLHGKIRKSARNYDLKHNTLIKVLRFSKYTPTYSNSNDDNQIAIHLKTISVVSLDPGHKFGNPVYYFDVFDANEFDDQDDVVMLTGTENNPIEIEVSQDLHSELSQQQRSSVDEDNGGTLLEMYSCRFTSDQKPIHSKIPSTGWKMDRHGCEPVPRARWIPAKPTEGKITTSLDTTSPSLLRNSTTNNNNSTHGRRG